MKMILAFILTFACQAFANSPTASDIRKPVGVPVILDTSTTNVTSGAWVTLIASTAYACGGLLLANAGSSPIKVGTGSAGNEVDFGVIFPSQATMMPAILPKGVRVAVRSMGATQSTGILSWSCFQ